MNRYRIVIASLLLGLCAVSYCHASDKVAVDLVNYMNQEILRIADMETKALEQYASVIGENYTTDEKVYTVLKDDVIPLYRRFLKALREIAPQTDEVRRVHQAYVSGAEYMEEGFKMKRLGLENNNESIIIIGNRKIEKGREEISRFQKEYKELCDQHGVAKIDEKKQKEVESEE